MKMINSFDLKSLAESITEATDLEQLKTIEDQCLLHFSEAVKTASNWIKEEESKSTGLKVTELVDLRRRQILAQPGIQKAKVEYALGQAIGQA